MAFNAKVSIALITYNQEKFVAKTIESILNQSYSNFELLIGDDCSTDNTFDVISSYKDERIKIIQQDYNGGINANLNTLMANASGDYVVFIAGDDKLRQNYLEVVMRYFTTMPNIDVLYQQLCPIDKDDNYIMGGGDSYYCFTPKRTLEQNLHLAFMQENIFSSPGMVMKKKVVDKIFPLPYSLVNFQDMAMHCDILINGFTVYVVDEILVDYRISGENISINNDKYLIRESLEIDYLMNYFLKIKDVELLKRIFSDEIKNFNIKVYADTIPFFLGQMALLSPMIKRQEWGYHTIMRYLSDKKNYNKVHQRYNFTFKDLLNLIEKIKIPQNDEELRRYKTKYKKYKKCFNISIYIFIAIMLLMIFIFVANL